MAEKLLESLSEFIKTYKDFINVCMVDFIVKDHFQLVNESIRNELLNSSEETLRSLPSIFSGNGDRTAPNLAKFVGELSSYTVDSVAISREALLNDLLDGKEESQNVLKHFDRIMSEKKMHEVVLMTEIVNGFSSKFTPHYIVDLGSGKGYLSQVIAAVQDKKVLAIDASLVNSDGNEKRSGKLNKQWSSLLRRAEHRKNFGDEPPSRGKHWKAKKLDVPIGDEKKCQEDGSAAIPKNLKIVTEFVDTQTDLLKLLEEQFPVEKSSGIGIVGLHTCGNLAPDSLRAFLANGSVKFICNVGCCYHHLDEKFYRNPHLSDEEVTKQNPSFPLSKFLRDLKFELGRNARMLAAQPMDRLVAKKPLPNQALLWRAILQVILLQHVPDLKVLDQQVGRIASKCKDFVDYVHKAFDKLSIELKMSDSELQQLHTDMVNLHEHKLTGFYQLRAMFGPLIEGLILLDRLVYMQEQEVVSEAHLVKMFDPVVSPRCYAIVAIKK